MAGRLPTDRVLLEAIFREYYPAFAAFSEADKSRSTKIWVPIDIDALARRFGTDPDMVFGRMYYHLNGKYGQEFDGGRLEFFQMRVGADKHCVNFPFLASVLADLRQESNRFAWATAIAALSLVVSIASIAIAVLV
jgi:hypothetical protein